MSVMDWDWPFWTSRQHLMTQFAQRNRVLFVNPPLTFASDYLGARHDPRLRRKLIGVARPWHLRRVGRNIFVWNPPPSIPFNRVGSRTIFDSLLHFNQRIFRESLRRILDRLDFRQPILWVSFNAYYGEGVVGQLGEALSVYHCTDEISGFPGYSPFISEVEARLAANCDLVVATSEVLRESKARYNAKARFVPNAAEVELFEKAISWKGSEPEDLRWLPRPRAGFVGQIEYRFDAKLFRYMAEKMPAWSFVLIGPVQNGHEEVNALRNLPNIHFLGIRERFQLPGYLAGLDVALIPYKINDLTRGIYPLKLYEYLAAGRPVVATPIPSLQTMADRVYVAEDGPSFVQALERAVAEDNQERRQARSELARGETWEARAVEISALLGNVLREKKRLAMETRS